MDESLLKVRGISKHFGGVCAVENVHLDVPQRTFVGLVGPNGCGKTTLLNTIFGLYQPDDGDVYLHGKKITKLAPHNKYQSGIVNAFQFPRLFFNLNVLDNMIIAARNHRGDNLYRSLILRRDWQKQEYELAEKAMETLDLLELSHLTFQPAGELSGGQKKLLEIGRSIMADPKLLLLDEPAAGINPVLGRKMFDMLEHRRHGGISLFVIEHRLELLMEYANWVYVMDRGRIVLEGKPSEVAKDPKFYEVYIGEG
jgi:branched-chain amino acid transport system ATP-binding protein